LLWRDGVIVQSVNFGHTNIVGDAPTAVDFFNVWGVDEIILLNVSRSPDQQTAFYDTVAELSKKCFVPLTVGGWVSTTDHIRELLSRGADKVAINTAAVTDPEFIKQASETFGTQCITVSIDVKGTTSEEYEVYIDRGREPTGMHPREWVQEVEARGAGELFVT
jgi:cyclase